MLKRPDFLQSLGAGGALCLDFINTVGGHRLSKNTDYLESYGDFLGFTRGAGVLGAREEKTLATLTANDPEDAGEALAEARAARENLYRIFFPLLSKGRPAAADLVEFNERLSEALRHGGIVATDKNYSWRFRDMGIAFASPLWPILKDAGELLTSGRLERLRECGGDTCGWLFLDETKNRTRQWCDMASCGNRAKARRHRQRRKKAV